MVTACAKPPPHQPGHCNPLASGTQCMLPYPSSYFQVDDETTATGKQMAVPREAMPRDINGRPIRPDPGNRLDGFSPATPLLMFFPGGADVSALATQRDFAPSLSAEAPVQLFDMGSGERVMYFAELDQNGTAGKQALIV